MATVTKRVNGQLVETDDANTSQLASLAGMPVTPSTPAGVADLGANPDQAKMAGTPNQQKTVQEEVAKPADTLQTAQRTEAPRQQATAPEDAAKDKAGQLQQLGSLSTRVQGLIESDLKSLGTAQATVAQPQLDSLKPEVRAQAQTLLQAVIQNPHDVAALAAATQFWKDNALATVDGFTPEQFIATAQQTLGTSAASQVRDTLALKDLPLQDGEKASLDAAFGQGAWEDLSVPQMQQKLEALRQSEFSRVQGLKAEMATATGPRREQLLAELGDAAGAGVTGTEQSVKDLAKQVSQADTVTIGGEEHKVEDLLKDDQISSLVTRMLGDPALMANVAKSNPEFAKWVVDNKASLEQLAKDVQATQGEVRTIQQRKHDLANVPGLATPLSDDVMSAIFPDWDKVSSSVPDLSTSGIMNLLTTTKDSHKRQALANAFEAATTDPDMLKQLAGMDAGSIEYAFNLANNIENDKTGLLKDLTGVGEDENFVLDPAKQKDMLKYKAITDQITAAKAGLKGQDASTFNTAISDPATLDLLKSGEMGKKEIALLAQNPQRFEAYKAHGDMMQKLAKAKKAGDIDAALDAMFGYDVDVGKMNAAYEEAKKYAALGDKAAAAQLKQFKQFDVNKDGKIDNTDTLGLIKNIDADMGGGKAHASLADILGADDKTLKFDMRDNGTKLTQPSLDKKAYAALDSVLERDGKLTNENIAELPEGLRNQLLADPKLLKKYGKGMSAQGYQDYKVAKYKGEVNQMVVNVVKQSGATTPDEAYQKFRDLYYHGQGDRALEMIRTVEAMMDKAEPMALAELRKWHDKMADGYNSLPLEQKAADEAQAAAEAAARDSANATAKAAYDSGESAGWVDADGVMHT